MSSPTTPSSGKQLSAARTSSVSPVDRIGSSISAKPSRVKNLIHVTIKQLNDAANNSATTKHLLIGNTIVDTVRLCGILHRIEQDEHITTFNFYDGTGSIDGKIWPHPIHGRTDLTGAMMGSYYEFIGSVGHEEQNIWLVTCSARKVKDFNAVPLHYIRACSDYVLLTKPKTTGPQPRGTAQDTTVQEAHTNFGPNLSLDLDREAIIYELGQDYIRDSEDGASLSYLVNKLQVPPAILRKAVDALVQDGQIYATTDIYHYKIAQD